jgi:hypothetical protein
MRTGGVGMEWNGMGLDGTKGRVQWEREGKWTMLYTSVLFWGWRDAKPPTALKDQVERRIGHHCKSIKHVFMFTLRSVVYTTLQTYQEMAVVEGT